MDLDVAQVVGPADVRSRSISAVMGSVPAGPCGKPPAGMPPAAGLTRAKPPFVLLDEDEVEVRSDAVPVTTVSPAVSRS